MAMIETPHNRYNGAAAMPSKLLCDASTATTLISNAPDTAPAPGNRASRVCATTSPAIVARRIVQVVAVIMLDVGSDAASQADAAPASRASPSQISTRSGVVAALGAAAAMGRSALECARVQRLNAGASRATENRTTTHIE